MMHVFIKQKIASMQMKLAFRKLEVKLDKGNAVLLLFRQLSNVAL